MKPLSSDWLGASNREWQPSPDFLREGEAQAKNQE
jgi:hypothetical protein